IAGKIVGVQEETDAAAVLVADAGVLLWRRSFRQQQVKRGISRRSDAHPALALSKIAVFQQREIQRTRVPGDRLVVIAHQQRDLRNASFHGCASAARCNAINSPMPFAASASIASSSSRRKA